MVTLLASVAMLAALLAVYANHVLVSSSGFSDRAVRVVGSGDVEALIVSTVTGRLAVVTGDAAAVEPLVDGAVRAAVANGRFNGEIRAAAGLLHRELMSDTANSLTLTLPNAGSAIAAGLGSQNPDLASALEGLGSITVLDVGIPSTDAQIIHHATLAARQAWMFVLLAVALTLLALTLSPDRRRTLRALGLGALVVGLVVAAGYLVGRGVVVNRFSGQDARTLAHAAWSVYLGGLMTWGLVLAAVGLVVATAASVKR